MSLLYPCGDRYKEIKTRPSAVEFRVTIVSVRQRSVRTEFSCAVMAYLEAIIAVFVFCCFLKFRCRFCGFLVVVDLSIGVYPLVCIHAHKLGC